MKILYGVPGEGMGHATRSKVILNHLLKSHDVRIVSSSRAFKLLESTFGSKVHEIRGFQFVYNRGGVSKVRTLASILKHSSKDFYKNFKKYVKLHKVFEPDLVISDFESFSYFFGKFNKIPVISIDNMQVIDRCRLDFFLFFNDLLDSFLGDSRVTDDLSLIVVVKQ